MPATFDQLLDAKYSRRQKAEERYQDRMERREREADAMVGELCREGRTVYYVMPVGGKYRESANRWDLVAYLIRNNHA